MDCPTCGEHLGPGEASCGRCGWLAEPTRGSGPSVAQRPGPSIRGLVLAAVLGLGVGVVLGATGATWMLSAKRQVEGLASPARRPPERPRPLTPDPQDGDRARAVDANCDGLFHALDGQIANELDWVVTGGSGDAACGCRTNECVIACALDKHGDEMNPRNRSQGAYTASASGVESCQVLFEPYGKTGVTVSQRRQPGGELRSFRIWVD